MSDKSNKHTPGPWTIEDWGEDNGPNKTIITGTQLEVLRPGQSSIWPNGVKKLCIADVADNGNAEADGYLIAAAPELFHVVDEMLNEENNDMLKWAGVVRKARAAIAKAKGES